MKLIADTRLRLTFAELRSAGLALAIGLAFGAWMAVADATVFAGTVPEVQRIGIAEAPAWIRVVVLIPHVVLDEIVLRLICMTALVALFVALAGRRRMWCYALAIALVAGVAYPLRDYPYFAALDWSALTVAREIALHFAASALWGWLYWRHGFLAAVTGHCAAHVTLQPLLSLLA